MRSSASQTLLPATQRRCTETVAAMARRKRRLAPQRNHTDSVITFYNRDTKKQGIKWETKRKNFDRFRQTRTEWGIEEKNKRTRSATRGREKAVPLLSKPQRWGNCPTARGREKAVHLLSKPQRRSNCRIVRGREKAGQLSEEPPCCVRTAQNGAATLRCLMRSGALPREGTFAVSLCTGCPPVEIW